MRGLARRLGLILLLGLTPPSVAVVWGAPAQDPVVIAQIKPFPDPLTPPTLITPLTVQKIGAGTGTVTGLGIDCGGDCSQSFNRGYQVTLTATPAVGSIFEGWSGACSGTAACVVTMSGALTVTASFSTIRDLEVRFTDNAPDALGVSETSFTIERCTIVAPATSCSDFIFMTSLPAAAGAGSQVMYTDTSRGPSCYRAKALATNLPDSSYTNVGCWP